jgi:hypothetical protein
VIPIKGVLNSAEYPDQKRLGERVRRFTRSELKAVVPQVDSDDPRRQPRPIRQAQRGIMGQLNTRRANRLILDHE